MLAYAPAVLLFLMFCFGVVRERRRFSNAVLLGLATLFAPAPWLLELVREDPQLTHTLAIWLVALAVVCIVVLSGFLISNGVTMLRKEGRSPANLMSLLAGVALAALLALLIVARVQHTRTLLIVAGTAVALVGYCAFLFLCFIVYAFLYGRLHLRRRTDYVVVLGSGLVNGSSVPPLLASRLERARRLHAALSKRGGRPILLTSGGQGPDEELPESHAMADYLVERGFPAELIEREDRSTTTDENLRFSKAIMEEAVPGYRCVMVTNNYHVFRAAVTARRAGVRGHVVGAPTAAYFWPSAMLREFVALFLAYRRTNLGICVALLMGGVLVWWS
ncbi:YdcF family protein [Streptomyces sp. BH105]|uniref:YdcF family protein n=1 Tax=Streptomyces sp. BH105 TaxID=3410408 RepID=UPI003CF8305E